MNVGRDVVVGMDANMSGMDASVRDAADEARRPRAFITARRSGGVGTTIPIDGSDSYGFTAMLEYNWTLTARPPGSNALLTMGAEMTTLRLDVPGAYEVTLVVFDGMQSSRPTSVTIGASPYVGSIVEVLSSVPWQQVSQGAYPMAADSLGRLFVADFEEVFLVEDGVATVYMDLQDLEAIAGPSPSRLFRDLDIDENDTLYILSGHEIIASTTAHTGSVVADVSSLGISRFMAVMDSQAFAVTSTNGLSLASTGTSTIVYDGSIFRQTIGCANQDLSIQRSGIFLHAEGCNGSDLDRGNIDGSDYGVLYSPFAPVPVTFEFGPVAADNFGCHTRNPVGGFYVVARLVEFPDDEPYILQVDEARGQPVVEQATTPRLDELEAMTGSLSFLNCAIAASTTGTIFITSSRRLFRVDL